MVALASSKYFSNAKSYAKTESLKVFDAAITWSDVATHYGSDKLLFRAEALYKMERNSC